MQVKDADIIATTSDDLVCRVLERLGINPAALEDLLDAPSEEMIDAEGPRSLLWPINQEQPWRAGFVSASHGSEADGWVLVMINDRKFIPYLDRIVQQVIDRTGAVIREIETDDNEIEDTDAT